MLIFLLAIIVNPGFTQEPRTRIRLFQQTTLFDSIISKNDSIFFYTEDIVVGGAIDTTKDKAEMTGETRTITLDLATIEANIGLTPNNVKMGI